MLSKPHEGASNTVGYTIIQKSGLNSHVKPGGSYEIYLRLHSMHDICSTVFIDPHTVEKAQKVVANKKRDGLGTKLPDYTAYPTYLPLIRFIQGAPTIPTFMIETGMSDQTVKVEVDCISIILGVGFNVEAVLGIDLKVNQASQKLGSMGLIIFDVSVGAMFDLFNSLVDSYEKALVSMVLKRKAQFKKDEVEAICKLKECIDGGGDYDSLCNNIAKQYRRRMKHDRMRHLNAPEIPDKELTRKVLNCYEFQTAELIAEGNYYQDLINRCNEASGYFGVQELLDPDTIRKAEAFMMQQLYRRRKVQTVTAEVQQDLIIPITALSSTNWCKHQQIVVPSDILELCFGEISLHCTKSRVEQCTVDLNTPWEHLQQHAHASVALLNRPVNVPKEAALGHLRQLYQNRSQGPPSITTKLTHWSTKGIKAQLTEWRIPADGTRYVLLIKFLDKYAEIKGSSPRTPPTECPISSDSVSNLKKGIKRVKMSSSGSDQKNLPPEVARCLTMVTRTKRTKLRKLLLQDGLDQVLLEINDKKLAIEGLKILFQEALPAAKFLLSKHSDPKGVVLVLQSRGAALRQG
uniref:ARAD1A15070p n=1 Tax=Blastobotrys adeninivorans TaxID=409370 RepID=A0A060T4A4_BLAAD